MIEPALAAAVAKVAQRANDVLGAYSSGFEPHAPEVLRRSPIWLADAGTLSVGAPNDAYFIVVKDGRTLFTRDGAFCFERGKLQTIDGAQVLGRTVSGAKGELVALRLDSRDAVLRPPRDVRIDADGTVSFLQSSVDPTSGKRREQRVALGRVALARFPAGTQPIRADPRHLELPVDVAPMIGLPRDGTLPPLRTHVRELGRVDLEAGLRRLQEAYLTLEALQAAHRTNGEIEKGAMDLLK